MSLYAIGDLHLSLKVNKPMDVFGPGWAGHIQRLEEAFSRLGEEDVTVLCGDTSWGIDFAESLEDFRWIDRLPGRKLIVKGNHDYWWNTAAKMRRFFQENGIASIDILHNNCFFYGEYALCGTRGWFFEEEQTGHNEKVLNREAGRLEASLRAAGDRPKLAFLHYPPCTPATAVRRSSKSWRNFRWSGAFTAISTAPPISGPSRERWAAWPTAWCRRIIWNLSRKKL